MFIEIKTEKWQEAIDITSRVQEAIKGESGKACFIFCPHTTAGLMINEPDAVSDVLDAVDEIEPKLDYTHKSNAQAHVKSGLAGVSLLIPMKQGKLELGNWQKIFFLEFDGPRDRKVQISIL